MVVALFSRARARSLSLGVPHGHTESGGLVLAVICWARAPRGGVTGQGTRALCLPAFSHLLTVNKNSLSLALALALFLFLSLYEIPNCWLLSARSRVHAESVGLLLDSLVEICLLAVECGRGRRGEDGVKRVLMYWPHALASKLDRGTRNWIVDDPRAKRGALQGGHTCGL